MEPAVLFDLDGTLIDSAPVWRRALATLVADRCGTVAADALDDVVGRVLDDAVGRTVVEAVLVLGRHLQWPTGRHATDVGWVEQFVSGRLRNEVVWREGALELVQALRKTGASIGLVTSSVRHVVDAVRENRSCPAFDVVVNGDDVAATKPAPEPYRAAACRLGLAADACVAIEDSTVGVESALAAGCAVVAVGPNAGCPDQRHSLRVDSLLEVKVEDIAELRRKRISSSRCRE